MTVGELKKALEKFQNDFVIRVTLESPNLGQIEDTLGAVFLVEDHSGRGPVVMMLGEHFD